MTVWLLNRLKTEKRAFRAMPSTGSVQVTLAPTLYTHGMRPKAPLSEYTSSPVVSSPQPDTQSQPEPPPPHSPGPPALRSSLGQRTPNALLGPPERADA